MDIYQGYDIIATEHVDKARLETEYQNFKQHIESLPTELNENKPRFFIRYEIDITHKNWTQIFNSIYPNEEIRYPDIIQFNFPWYKDTGDVAVIVEAFFEYGKAFLKKDGLLKLGLLINYSYYDSKYDFKEELYNKWFTLNEEKKFKDLYKSYVHVSSDPNKKINNIVDYFGIEYTFKWKCEKNEERIYQEADKNKNY